MFYSLCILYSIFLPVLTLTLDPSNTSPHCDIKVKIPTIPPSQKLFYCQLPTPFKKLQCILCDKRNFNLELSRISKNSYDKTLLYHPQLQILPIQKPHPDLITNKTYYY